MRAIVAGLLMVACSLVATAGFWFLRTGRQSLGILVMLTFTAVMDARVCVCVSGRKRCFCLHDTRSQQRSS